MWLTLIACFGPRDATRSTESECASLTSSDCVDVSGCIVLAGIPIDSVLVDTAGSEACVVREAQVDAACIEGDLTCPPAVAYAESPSDGRCHEFQTGCTPDGWGDCDADFSGIHACAD